MAKKNSKVKIELNQQQLAYLLGMIDIDIRQAKDKEYIANSKKLFNYLKNKL